jgi:hypothetical protein
MLDAMEVRATFALIGPGKSGTTALYNLLARNPQVAMARVKETCFFNDHHQRGEAWYRALFPSVLGPEVRAVGEVSNTYIFCAEAAARMRAYNPAMRAIACLRNPVDRAFSHWLFLRRNAEVTGTFEDALRARPDLVERGRYAALLEPWFRALGRDQVQVLLFQDFAARPLEVYNRLLAFIGADPVERADLREEDRLPASAPRSRTAARAVKMVADAVRRAGHPRVIQWVKDSPLPRLLYRPYARHERPRMRDDTRARLAGAYADDVARLGALLGRDLAAEWGIAP